MYRTSSLDSDSKLIYSYIKDAGSEGIWTKDLKKRTNLHLNVVNRVLKSLEQKQLVKSVKHVKVEYRYSINMLRDRMSYYVYLMSHSCIIVANA